MKEREMEDLLWEHPEKLLNEPLKQFRRQPRRPGIGRADLVFTDRLDRLLVIEIKHGTLPRGAVPQVIDYFGMMKREFPDRPVEMMVVANVIPAERRISCEQHHIEPREISDKKFRDVANEVGYLIQSEQGQSAEPVAVGNTQPVPSGRLVTTPPATPHPLKGEAKGLARSGMPRYDANGRMSPERKRRVALRKAFAAKGLRIGADRIDPLIMAGLSDDEIIRRLTNV